MKWIGQHIYDLVSRFREDVYIEENDFYMYNPTTVGNPTIRMGANEDEMLQIKAAYQSGTQSMQVARFTTFTESGTANDGKFQFWPDSVRVLDIDDGGIDFQPNTGISINGTDILTDSSGTATLSNIDALDATTIATFETAMEANLDTFGSQMTSASALATVGTIGTGTWQGTAIASAYLDHDTAHLSTTQTFTGAKTFTINPVVFGGNRTLTPGDGAFIHQDTAIITDGNTSEDGTAAIFSAVNIEGARLAATNSSVTTTAAASLYIKNAPTASTNQTITNAYALWVDDGLVKFDGALTVGGTITGDVTGDVTGDLTGRADTVGTIAGLAPNTATTQGTQAAITTCANLATVGTITTGVWNGTTITKANGGTGLHGETDGKIVIADGSGAPSFLDVGSSTGITILGTVATGVWNGTKVASAYLDDDTAHLSGTQTFTGVKTFDQAINKKALFHMQTQNRFSADTDDEYYFSLADVERDVPKGSEAGIGVVAMIPCDGILKQVILNTSSNISGQSWEWKVYRVPSGTVATSEILIATVASDAGPTSNTNKVISFVTDPEDGTNDISYEGGYDATTMFTAGDRVLFSQESNADASGSPKINIIMSFELDESTI